MNYYICTEIKMKCPSCDQHYNIQVKDLKSIDVFDVTCDCGTKCKEINEYGGWK